MSLNQRLKGVEGAQSGIGLQSAILQYLLFNPTSVGDCSNRFS